MKLVYNFTFDNFVDLIVYYEIHNKIEYLHNKKNYVKFKISFFSTVGEFV